MRQLEKINERIGHVISWFMLALAITTFTVVVLRYVFNYGRVDLQEISTYLHAITLMLCMGYTMRHNEHVRVDIFYQGLNSRQKALVNLIGHWVFLTPVCVTILFVGWDYAYTSWTVLEKSTETGGLPFVFVIKSLPLVMAVLLIFQGVSDSVQCLSELRNTKK